MRILAFAFLLSFLGCNSKAQTVKEKLDSLFQLALKADSLEDYKASILYYNQMIDIDGVNLGALVNRGRALMATSKIQEGFTDLNKAVKLYPDERTYFARSVAYMSLNNLDSAEKDLKTAKNLNPLFTETYYARCNLHLLKKEYLLALYDCELGDKFGINKTLSSAMKTEMSKVLGNDIVANFNYDTIVQTIKNIPKVKKAQDKSLRKKHHGLNYGVSLDKTTGWLYTITVRDGESDTIQFVFKMDAATLKVLNPDGKNRT